MNAPQPTKPATGKCLRCRELAASWGVLCERCASQICAQAPLCQEQISSQVERPEGAALVDQWGRVFGLGATTAIGRQAVSGAIGIAEPSVSRRHAIVRRGDEEVWQVVDLESSNGTRINDQRIAGVINLRSGDTVFFGQVGFVF